MEQEKPTVLQKLSKTNIKRPGRIGCVFGLVAGVGAGYIPSYQNAVAGVCPKQNADAFKNCFDAAMVGTVLVAVLTAVAVDAAVGMIRRRHLTGPK
jgi:fructose-specific phosphotransferase system IIC component